MGIEIKNGPNIEEIIKIIKVKHYKVKVNAISGKA